MSDLFDTTHIHDDPAHWDALTARVVASAGRSSQQGGVDWLAHSRAGWFVASLVLAAALVSMLLPDKTSAAENADWAQVLAPSDDLARAIMLRDGPPAISVLLLGGQGGGAR